MHHDGLHFFPLPAGGSSSSTHGLLAVNHEYTDYGPRHPGGMQPGMPEKVRKSQAAHGVSVVEVRRDGARRGSVVRPFGPRVPDHRLQTPMAVSGPAAGHALLHSRVDPDGRAVLGTINNCAIGGTPWGTYSTCEENFNDYFVNATGDAPASPDPAERKAAMAAQKRYGIADKSSYRSNEHDARFDAAAHPNEGTARLDRGDRPLRPREQPVKHTALGRFKHEARS